MYERMGDIAGQAECLNQLSQVFLDDGQLDAAEDATYHGINLMERGQEYDLCQFHQVLGDIYESKGEKEKKIHHFKIAIRIASPPNWHSELFWIHYQLSILFRCEDNLGNANTSIEQAKSYVNNDPYNLACAMHVQALVWYLQDKLEASKLEALDALKIYEEIGSAHNAESCRGLLQEIKGAIQTQSTGFQQ